MSILRRTSSGFGPGASSGWGVFGVFMGLYVAFDPSPGEPVTPEMVEAGLAILCDADSYPGQSGLVEMIYYAMQKARCNQP